MNKDILPFWQEIGTSTSIIAKKVSEKLGIPTSHTGTLDPLASGVVLVVKGEEYFNKEKYIQNIKQYNFDILFGFSTDTHDGMGIITDINQNNFSIDLEKLKEIILGFKGNYKQKYPEFSSKKINGKSLWEYKRLGLEVPEVFIDGKIIDIKISEPTTVRSSGEISLIIEKINQVSGNFRQQEILQKYSEAKFPDQFIKINLEVEMTRGLYVRGWVRDISQKINSNAIVINLVRTKDGDFTKKECLSLKEFFSEELEKNPSFFSPQFKNLK